MLQLWQIYLENVDPLFKVTHWHTLQPRIAHAMNDVRNISAPLEALLFSIYSVSLQTISEEQCQAVFGSLTSKGDLMTRYQFACRQALCNCRFLHSRDHDCLVALYLYLVSMALSLDHLMSGSCCVRRPSDEFKSDLHRYRSNRQPILDLYPP
jgi:hypothetical protein